MDVCLKQFDSMVCDLESSSCVIEERCFIDYMTRLLHVFLCNHTTIISFHLKSVEG